MPRTKGIWVNRTETKLENDGGTLKKRCDKKGGRANSVRVGSKKRVTLENPHVERSPGRELLR